MSHNLSTACGYAVSMMHVHYGTLLICLVVVKKELFADTEVRIVLICNIYIYIYISTSMSRHFMIVCV